MGAYIINSNKRVYVVTAEASKLYFASFTFDTTSSQISPSFYKSYGSASVLINAKYLALSPSFLYAYVTTTVNNKLCLAKLNVADETSSYFYYVNTPTSVASQISLT